MNIAPSSWVFLPRARLCPARRQRGFPSSRTEREKWGSLCVRTMASFPRAAVRSIYCNLNQSEEKKTVYYTSKLLIIKKDSIELFTQTIPALKNWKGLTSVILRTVNLIWWLWELEIIYQFSLIPCPPSEGAYVLVLGHLSRLHSIFQLPHDLHI